MTKDSRPGHEAPGSQTRAENGSDLVESTLFREFFRISPDAIVLLDNEDRVLKANPAFTELFGFTEAEAMGKPINELIVDPAFHSEATRYSSRVRSLQTVRGEALRSNKQGDLLNVEIFGTPLVVDNRRIGVYALYRDITARKQAEDLLEQSEAKHRSIVECMEDGYFEVDLSGNLLFFNQSLARILEQDSENLVDFNYRHYFDQRTNQDLKQQFGEILKTGQSNPCVRWQFTGKSGEKRYLEASVSLILAADQEPAGYRGMVRDVSERRRQEAALAWQATHDALTGLRNRFHFELAANRLGDDAARNDRTHTFLYMDLDQFKVVNDTCGHHAGDELLRLISAQIVTCVRQQDVLARLGGDEFGLLLADCDLADACRIAEKVIHVVNDFRFEWDSHSFEIGISIGIVAIDGRLDFIELLKAADQACYVAKDHGRNRFQVYHDEDRTLQQRTAELQAVADVTTAIKENRFELHAQRIVPLDPSTATPGHELLLRMRGRDGQLIPPGQFIRGAERYNRMTVLDRWVVEHALDHIGSLCAQGELANGSWFSINLSGPSINDQEFGDYVCAMLDKHRVDPSRVCFEITESSAITHHRQAVRFLTTVRERGCRVMLDDFGSGLSSFAYLKTLPIDFIKLDGSLIRGITQSEFSLAIIQAIHDVARVLGLPLIAEHVEIQGELDRLRGIGVEYAQGFYLHRPEPWDRAA